jgi:hypothetical protein
MFKSIVTAGVMLAVLCVLASDAQAIGRRRQCSQSYAVVAAPAAPVATAQAAPGGQGYRTYSYEPSATAAPVYTPMRSMREPPYMNPGRHSAGYKLTDF